MYERQLQHTRYVLMLIEYMVSMCLLRECFKIIDSGWLTSCEDSLTHYYIFGL